MRDDPVAVFQRLVVVNADIAHRGPYASLLVKKANLALALGDADQAVGTCAAILAADDALPLEQREAKWLTVIGYCLRAAVLEGTLVGAPGVKVTKADMPPEKCRAEARKLLEGMESRQTEEQYLLHLLQRDLPLGHVERLIEGFRLAP